MGEPVEGLFRKNDTLDNALSIAMARDGCGLLERMIVKSRIRRLPNEARIELERELTRIVVESGVPMPVGASVVGGILVGNWTDFISVLIDKLPQILEFLSGLFSLFLLFA